MKKTTKQVLDEMILYVLKNTASQTLTISRIKQAVLNALEELDAYEAIDDQGEDKYGKVHIKNMGDCILIKDAQELLLGDILEKRLKGAMEDD